MRTNERGSGDTLKKVLMGIVIVCILGLSNLLGDIKEVEAADSTWQSSYSYTLDSVSTPKTITLTKYNGSETSIVVPSTAVISGVTYQTKLKGGKATSADTIWYNVRSTATDITIDGAIISEDSTLRAMFQDFTSLQSVNFTASSITVETNLNYMFMNCINLKSVTLTGFNVTSTFKYTNSMFQGCSSLKTLDLSGLKTSAVTQMKAMFKGCTTIEFINMGGVFSMASIPNAGEALDFLTGCTSLKRMIAPVGLGAYLVALPYPMYNSALATHNYLPQGAAANYPIGVKYTVTWKNLSDATIATAECIHGNTVVAPAAVTSSGITNWDTPLTNIVANTTIKEVAAEVGWFSDYSYTLNNSTTPKTITLNKYNGTATNIIVPATATIGGTVYNTKLKNTITAQTETIWYSIRNTIESIEIQGAIIEGQAMRFLLTSAPNLTSASIVATNTSGMTTVSNTFAFSNSLSSVSLTGFNSNPLLTTSNGMFYDCESLVSLDLTGFDVSKVTNFGGMFAGCISLSTLNVSTFNTSSATEMHQMFSGCSSLTSLNVSSFDTSKVTSTEYMFSGCEKLTSLDLSNFNTSNVQTMMGMFDSCSALTSIDFSNFDTSKVTDMNTMFSGCLKLTSLNLGNFNTANVTNMNGMFSYCVELMSLNVTSFNTAKVTNMADMFYNCSKLTTLNISNFDMTLVTVAEDFSNMLIGMTSLKVLDTPKNVKVFVDLPTTMYGPTFTTYSYLPMNSATSINIRIKYTVDFKDKAGVSIEAQPQNVRYMENAVVPVNASLMSITTWDTTYTNITANKVVTALDGITNWHTEYTYTLDSTSTPKTITLTKYNGSSTDIVVPDRALVSGTVYYTKLKGGITNPVDTIWYSVKGTLKSINLDGVILSSKSLSYLFYDFKQLNSARISCSDISSEIELNAIFSGCSALTNVEFVGFNSANNITEMAAIFYGCTSLTSGDLSVFNTSKVTRMMSIFMNCSNLTSVNFSGMNTSKVRNISQMFYGCSKLTNIDLSQFAGALLNDIFSLFSGCSSLISVDLSMLNVNNVTSLDYLFFNCTKLTSVNLTGWNTANVTSMYYTFRSCSSLTSLAVNHLITTKVTNFDGVFASCAALTSIDISSWDTSSATTMVQMFASCSMLSNLNLGIMETANVTNMMSMFAGCSKLESLDLSSFNTIKTNNIAFMFSNCTKLTAVNLSSFNTANVTNMSGMFNGCGQLTALDISNFTTSKVTTIASMFKNTSKITYLNIKNFSFQAMTTATDAFTGCTGAIEIDMSNINLSGITLDPNMFMPLTNLKVIHTPLNVSQNVVLPVSMYDAGFVLYNVLPKSSATSKTIKAGFTVEFKDQGGVLIQAAGSSQIVRYLEAATAPDVTAYGITSWDKTFSSITANTVVTALDGIYAWYADYNYTLKETEPKMILIDSYKSTGKTSLTLPSTAVISGTTYATSFSNRTPNSEDSVWASTKATLTSLSIADGVIFPQVSDGLFANLTGLTTLNLGSINSASMLTANRLFKNCSSLTTLDLSNLNTASVDRVIEMFSGCSGLTSLDLSGFNTSNIVTTSMMFSDCESLTSINMSGWNTSKLKDMSAMFSLCTSLTSLDIKHFDTSEVINMTELFFGCVKLTSLDITTFDTSKVIGMGYMFDGCASLTTLDISNFNTASVQFMNRMFSQCRKLTYIDLSNFNTSSVVVMSEMFAACESLISLDLSGFNTANLVTTYMMFAYCPNLTNLDLSNFDTSKVEDMSLMFAACDKLESVNVSSFNTTAATSTMGMFGMCPSLIELDLSNFDMTNVADASMMFFESFGLKTLKSPKNLQVDVDLPVTMYTTTLTPVTTLPKNSATSEDLRVGYTVDFRDLLDASIESPLQIVRHGENAVEPTITEPTFAGWDIPVTNVTTNLVARMASLNFTIEVPNTMTYTYDSVAKQVNGTVEIKMYGSMPGSKKVSVTTQTFNAEDMNDPATQYAAGIGAFKLTQIGKSPCIAEFNFNNTSNKEEVQELRDVNGEMKLVTIGYRYTSSVDGLNLSTQEANPTKVIGNITIKNAKSGAWTGSMGFVIKLENTN